VGIVSSVFQDPENQVVMTRVDNEVAFGLENMAVAPEQIRAMQNRAAERVDVAGVASHQQRRHDGIERRLGRRDGGVPEGFAPTDQTVVGLDLHHENLLMVPGLARK
jgi:hypothetical protein